MKRSLTLLLVLIATAVNAADLAIATRHTELRAFYLTPSRANPSPSPKVQWAPSGNFQALHGRAVFRRETETASRPYAREEGNTAAGAGIFLSRDSFEGTLNSAPSLHRFAYAHANPLRYTDPTGHYGDWGLGEAIEMQEAVEENRVEEVSKRHEQQDQARAAGVLTGLAIQGGAAAVAWEATAGPLVEASLTIGRGLLARSGVRAALYAAAGPLARLTDQVVGVLDPSGALAPVSGTLVRETDRALARSVRSYPITTTVEELKPPPLNVHMSSSGTKAPAVAEVAESIGAPGTTTYWHGTTAEGAENVAKGIDLSKGRGRQDFDPNGQGSFYVTKDKEQAERWARQVAGPDGQPALVRYEVPDSALQSLEGKNFSGADSAWQEFVKKSRTETGGPEHHIYDYVQGPFVTNPRDTANLMSAVPPKGRGNQLAVCTSAAACVFDASNPTPVPVR